MDFEFRHDILGQRHASLPMEQETMALWLLEELGEDLALLSILQQRLSEVLLRQRWEYEHMGREFCLSFRQSGVELGPHLSAEGGEGEDWSQVIACCGLDDFSHLLSAWKDFIRS